MSVQTAGRVDVEGVGVPVDHYIDGARVASADRFEVRSPIEWDGWELARMAAGGAAEVDAAVRAARRAFPAWAALGPGGRHEILTRLADAIDAAVGDLARVECVDNGSLYEAMHLRVLPRAANNIRFFADYAVERLDESPRRLHGGERNRVRYDPSGVVAVSTPWNAPFMLATWRVGPALAAGNTVVLKPPEWAPLTCSLLGDLADEAGVPAGVLNIVHGTGAGAGAPLTGHPGVDRVAFTGSPATARTVYGDAAANLTPVSFELGGKSPFIVFEDADLDAAASTAAYQFDNSGQVCLAGTRLLVQASVLDEFLARFTARSEEIVVGDPRGSGDDVRAADPSRSRSSASPVTSSARWPTARGSSSEAGRSAASTTPRRCSPTSHPGPKSSPTRYSVRCSRCRRSPMRPRRSRSPTTPRTGWRPPYSPAPKRAPTALALAVVAGTVWVNCFYVRDLETPFGGSRESGIGREGGRHSFDFYCDVKTVCERTSAFTVR